VHKLLPSGQEERELRRTNPTLNYKLSIITLTNPASDRGIAPL